MSKTSSHIKVLKDYDCIELVKTEPRRGAVEHYRAKAEMAVPEPGIVFSARQRRLLGLIGDTLNDPDAPTYTAAERRELVAALAALSET